MLVFSKDEVPSDDQFSVYRKKVDTRAARIVGEFRVETSEGPLTCKDGYLCMDARGYPYPVAKDEFDLIYGPAQAPGAV